MDWKDEEVEQAWTAAKGMDVGSRAATKAIMTRAVELAAARGGTMTAEVLKVWSDVHPESQQVIQHISALGARNAVLEAEVTLARKGFDAGSPAEATIKTLETEKERTLADWREYKAAKDADVAAWKEENERLKERLSAAEEGNRELVRRAQQAESSLLHANKTVLELRTALAEAQEQHRQSERKHANLSPAGQAGDKSAAVQLVELAVEAGLPVRFVPQHHPCSLTCTHDDAAKPGHPERVKVRSEAVKQAAAPDPVGQLALKAGAKPGREIASYRAGYEQGCDDMRAACLAAALAWAERERHLSAYEIEQLKAAIEGAAL